MIWLLFHLFSIWSQFCLFQILQWFPFAPRMTWNLFDMDYKALNYLTTKYLSVLPHTKFPLTLIVSYNDLLYQSGYDRLSYYNKHPPYLGILKIQRLIYSVLNVYQQWWGWGGILIGRKKHGKWHTVSWGFRPGMTNRYMLEFHWQEEMVCPCPPSGRWGSSVPLYSQDNSLNQHQHILSSSLRRPWTYSSLCLEHLFLHFWKNSCLSFYSF